MKKPVRSHKKKEPEGPKKGTVAWADKQLGERQFKALVERGNSKESLQAFCFFAGKVEGIMEVRGILSTVRIPKVKKKG